MTTWNYIIGNEKDFEGAPDWASILCEGTNCNIWHENDDYSGRWCNSEGGGRGCDGRGGFPIVAQRERVTDAAPVATNDSKYNRPCKGITIDVYDVLKAFNVTCPALQHLIKKALAVGQRGHKDASEDLKDILASAKRAIELSEGDK